MLTIRYTRDTGHVFPLLQVVHSFARWFWLSYLIYLVTFSRAPASCAGALRYAQAHRCHFPSLVISLVSIQTRNLINYQRIMPHPCFTGWKYSTPLIPFLHRLTIITLLQRERAREHKLICFPVEQQAVDVRRETDRQCQPHLLFILCQPALPSFLLFTFCAVSSAGSHFH